MKDLVIFKGVEIPCTQHNGNFYVAVTPICEHIGLRSDKAIEAVKNNRSLAKVMRILSVEGSRGMREMVCLPISHISGWLSNIDINKVNEKAQPVLEAYQDECYRVLFEHFFGRQEAHNRASEVFVELHTKRAQLRELQKQQADSEIGKQIAATKKEIRTLEVEQASLDHEMFGKQLTLSPTI